MSAFYVTSAMEESTVSWLIIAADCVGGISRPEYVALRETAILSEDECPETDGYLGLVGMYVLQESIAQQMTI